MADIDVSSMPNPHEASVAALRKQVLADVHQRAQATSVRETKLAVQQHAGCMESILRLIAPVSMPHNDYRAVGDHVSEQLIQFGCPPIHIAASAGLPWLVELMLDIGASRCSKTASQTQR